MDIYDMEPFEKRFGGVGRLYGAEGLERLRRAHVCVVGLGGVGSWAVEGLARSGVGRLSLVDFDNICISNTNRQLHAVEGNLGRPKAEVMAQRVQAINPECAVLPVQALFSISNADEILRAGFDALFDAIDTVPHKCLLIARCRERGIPIVSAGGAGGRRDPSAIEVADLAFSGGDRLLQQVRSKLRQEHGFPRGNQPFGVECVFSRERAVYSDERMDSPDRTATSDPQSDYARKFGTAGFVTGVFGLVGAGRIVQHIATKKLVAEVRQG